MSQAAPYALICMIMKAAALYDRNLPCGAEANAGKFLGAEAAFKACQAAVMNESEPSGTAPSCASRRKKSVSPARCRYDRA